MSELDVETLQERLKRNRENALKRKQQFEEREQQRLQESKKYCEHLLPTTTTTTTTTTNDVGNGVEMSLHKCNNELSERDLEMFNNFGELCCFACQQLQAPDYEFLNKTDIASEYLLPTDSIQLMRFITKPNPHNPMWKPMKLYLRKHAKAKSFARFGDLEGLQAEKERRKQMKFQRDLENVSKVFDNMDAPNEDMPTTTTATTATTQNDPSGFSFASSELLELFQLETAKQKCEELLANTNNTTNNNNQTSEIETRAASTLPKPKKKQKSSASLKDIAKNILALNK